MTIGKAGSGQNLGFFSKKDFHFPFTTLKSSEKKALDYCGMIV
jgi:hypothetical protein